MPETVSELKALLKQKTEQLQACEGLFRATFNQTAVGLAHLGQDRRWLRINRKLCEIVGYTEEELRKLTFLDITHPDDTEASLGLFQKVMAGGIRDYRIEKRYVRKDGSVVWVAATASPVCDSAGRPDYLIAVIEDITERKRAEEALRVSETEKSLILNSTMDLIVYYDTDMKILWVNREAVESVGMQPQEFVGRHCWEIWHQRTEECTNCPVVLARGTGEPQRAEIRTPDGRMWYIRGFPVKDADGAVVGVVEFCLDITERKRMEEKIEILNTDLAARAVELEAANRELEAFSYTVSHDLRKPLSNINGFCQVLRQTYADRLDGEGRQYVLDIFQETLRMNQLINTLLDFARLSRCKIHRETVDLSAIANEIAAELRLKELQRRVTFTVAEGIKVNGDAKLLRVVMVNLLENAWKYSGKRDETLIEFGVTESEGKQAYFVRDNGVGFDMKDAGRLFGTFERLHSTADFEGHGIGLATVQRIIGRHGGKVWAEARKGEGATFYFSL